jgi:hypothetical protein
MAGLEDDVDQIEATVFRDSGAGQADQLADQAVWLGSLVLAFRAGLGRGSVGRTGTGQAGAEVSWGRRAVP